MGQFCLRILTGFPSPSLGCIPCVPLACTITCWLTFPERSLTWFTWTSWACVGTRWWCALCVTWPTIPRAFRSWLDARLKLATFPTLPAISQRVLSATWAWPATAPILNVGVSSPLQLCFLLLPYGFLSLWLAVTLWAHSGSECYLLQPHFDCISLAPGLLETCL